MLLVVDSHVTQGHVKVSIASLRAQRSNLSHSATVRLLRRPAPRNDAQNDFDMALHVTPADVQRGLPGVTHASAKVSRETAPLPIPGTSTGTLSLASFRPAISAKKISHST